MFNLDAHRLTDEQIAEIVTNLSAIEGFIYAVKKEVILRAESGKPIEGVKVVDGRATRKWNIDDDKVLKVLKKLGVPKEAMIETNVISVAQLEKLTWTTKDGREEGLSAEQVELINREYVVRIPGRPTVVPASDRRRAKEITPSVDTSELFTKI